jgi:ABC-2 type transport system ATP-binding protein
MADVPIGDILVSVQDVSKVYIPSPTWLRVLIRSSSKEAVTALAGVNLEVAAGEICAVVGPNGAGKSTMFRILTGLTTPTSGRAIVCGLDATRQSSRVRRLVGFMPADDRSLYLRNTCVENLRFHGRLQGMEPGEIEKRIDEVLEMVDLSYARDRVGFALSSGMRARLQLARALLHRPRVLILDEPTSSVDPVAAYELVQLIKGVAEQDKVAVLISSHRLEEVEELHDNVAMLNKGRIIYSGDLDVMRTKWEESTIEIDFATEDMASDASTRLSAMEGVELIALEGTQVTVATAAPTGALLARLDGHVDGIVSLRHTKMPLIRLFSKIVADEVDQ